MTARWWLVTLALAGSCERVRSARENAGESERDLRVPRRFPAAPLPPISRPPAPQNDPLTSTTTSEGCGSQLPKSPPPDLYKALVAGAPTDKGAAALAVLDDRSNQARGVVTLAIKVIGSSPYCPQLRILTDTLIDRTMDDTTRAAAALTLGVIARDFPCTFPVGPCPTPHDPIPEWSQRALRDCATGDHVAVARACVEALGYVPRTDQTLLRTLRDNTSSDSLLRLVAGRALTRITGTEQVTTGALEALMSDAHRLASQ